MVVTLAGKKSTALPKRKLQSGRWAGEGKVGKQEKAFSPCKAQSSPCPLQGLGDGWKIWTELLPGVYF